MRDAALLVFRNASLGVGGTHLLKLFAPKGAARKPSLVSSQVHDPPLTSTVARTIQYVEARTSSPRSSATGEGAHSASVRRRTGMGATQGVPTPSPLCAGQAGRSHCLLRRVAHTLLHLPPGMASAASRAMAKAMAPLSPLNHSTNWWD